MAYTVNKTDGTILATVADGTIDTTTDLTLIVRTMLVTESSLMRTW